MRGGSCRLDEQVGPAAVRRRVRQREPFGDGGAEQCEVPLRVRRDRPHVVVPDADVQRFDPVGHRLREVCGRVFAFTELEQALAERALIEAGASVGDDCFQGECDARAPDPIAAPEPAVGRKVVGAGNVAQQQQRRSEERRGREPTRRVHDGRVEHGRERQPPVLPVQRQPSVDATGHGRGSDVAGERHVRVTVEPQPLGVGAAAARARRR